MESHFLKKQLIVLLYCISISVIDDDNNQIIYRDYIDISVAVATPKVRGIVHYYKEVV